MGAHFEFAARQPHPSSMPISPRLPLVPATAWRED
jgi:hypothetical protein